MNIPAICASGARANGIIRFICKNRRAFWGAWGLDGQAQLVARSRCPLSMLAHRQHVPVKPVSIAANRVTGQNISRYINQYRIDAADIDLCNGASMTKAMQGSCFVTKSNINREFRRITGQAPSDYAQTTTSNPPISVRWPLALGLFVIKPVTRTAQRMGGRVV